MGDITDYDNNESSRNNRNPRNENIFDPETQRG